jgi:hypothetical protein
MRLRLALLCLALISPAFSQVIIDDGADTGGGSVNFEEQDTTGKINFDIDLSGKFTQEYFHKGKRLENDQGVPVTAYNISKDQSLIIGTINPNVDRVTINEKLDLKDGSKAIASFIHKNGQHQSLPPDQITAHDKDGNNKCFSVEPIGGKHNPIVTHVLIDRSGSMDSHMPSVKSALAQFTNALPPASMCSVTSFSTSATDHTNGFEMCRGVASKISGIKASGGTFLYKTLIDGYSKLDQSSAVQKFMLAITDGEDNSWTGIEDVKAAKNAQTFFLWAGNSNPTHLSEISDATLNAQGNIPAALNVFFKTLGDAVAKQQVLILPHTCADSSTGDRSETTPALKPREPEPEAATVKETNPQPTKKNNGELIIRYTDLDPIIDVKIAPQIGGQVRSFTSQYRTEDDNGFTISLVLYKLKEKKGKIVILEESDIQIFNKSGEKRCFSLTPNFYAYGSHRLSVFPSCS